LVSMTSGPERARVWRWLLLLCLTLLGAGCAGKQVVVEGNFPTPLMDPLPITVGVIYPQAFAEHEFFDEAKGRADSDWLVKTGEAQVEFWDKVFNGMFAEVVHIRDWQTVQTRGGELDGVIIPAISDLQYTIPTHTNVKIYEIWMRYDFRLVDISAIHRQEDDALTVNPDERLAAWPITAYGKTPTAFLQTDEEAVNLAAVVALRDAGAHFITTFGAMPDIAAWLDDIANESPDDGINPAHDVAPTVAIPDERVAPEATAGSETSDDTADNTSATAIPADPAMATEHIS